MAKPQYLELRYYNDTAKDVPVAFDNDRCLPILDQNYDYEITVARWDTDSDKIPCFIPKLYNPEIDYNFASLEFPQHFTFCGTHNNPNDTQYVTNLQIFIEYYSQDGTTNYANGFVKWRPCDINYIPPNVLSRANIINSQYFHCYSSLHICNLVATALTETLAQIPEFQSILSTQSILVEKIQGSYMLLLPSSMLNHDFLISFSDDLSDLFGFETVPHYLLKNCYELVIRKNSMTTTALGFPTPLTYAIINSGYLSAFMFPFASLVFKSNNMNVSQMLRYNNVNSNSNSSDPVITDFSFMVSDVDKFYNKLSYTADAYDRKIALKTNSDLRKVSIYVVLETPDNIQMPLLLGSRRTASILLQFSPIEKSL